MINNIMTLNRKYKELHTGKTITATGWDKATQRVFFNSDDYEYGHMLPLRLFKQRYIRAEHAGTTDADKKTVHKDKEA